MKILFLLLFPLTILLPQTNLDSMLVGMKDKPDTTKIKYLYDLCWKYRYNNPSLALESGEKALQMSRQISNKQLEARLLNVIGVVYRGKSDYDKSMAYATSALKTATECGDSVQMGYAENNIGGTYQAKSYYTLALEHISKALEIFESLNYKPGISFCTVIVGAIYENQKNYDKAMEYYNKSLSLRKEIGNRNDIGHSINSIAWIYLKKGSLDTAYAKFKEAEQSARELVDKSLLAYTLDGMSKILIAKGDYSGALKLQLNANIILNQISSSKREINSHITLSKIYSGLKKFKEAEQNLKITSDLLGKIKSADLLLDYYDAYSKFYELKGDFKKSLSYSRMYSDLKDSIHQKINIARSDELEAVDQYLKTKSENEKLQASLEFQRTQKTYLILISILLVITFITIYWRYRAKKADNTKLQELNAMKDLLFGIIAHDLKNPFNTILATTDMLLKELDSLSKDEIRTIVELIENSGQQTYRLLENLLYWSLAQTNNIQYAPRSIRLTELVNETLELLMNTARSKNISFSVNSSGDLEALCDMDMIKSVLRNLVSNGIKYSHEGGTVKIDLKKEDEFIEVSVEDYGIGIPVDRKNNLIKAGENASTPGTRGEKGTGLGLMLCKEFVEKNNGHFKIESEIGKGSRFIFTLPAAN